VDRRLNRSLKSLMVEEGMGDRLGAFVVLLGNKFGLRLFPKRFRRVLVSGDVTSTSADVTASSPKFWVCPSDVSVVTRD